MVKNRILKAPAILLAICLASFLVSCGGNSSEKDDASNPAPVESSTADAQIQTPLNRKTEEPEDAGIDDNASEAPDDDVALPGPIGDIAASIASGAASSEESQQDEESPIVDFPYAPFPYPFSTKDIYGNAVTEADLGEKRLFFIHHWATWCSSCVGGMPDLARVAETYEDQVGFIGLIDDYQRGLSSAKRIAKDSGVPSSFIMFDAGDNGLRTILNLVESGYLPTSVVMDSSGEVFEPKLIGSYGGRYAQLLDILLE